MAERGALRKLIGQLPEAFDLDEIAVGLASLSIDLGSMWIVLRTLGSTPSDVACL